MVETELNAAINPRRAIRIFDIKTLEDGIALKGTNLFFRAGADTDAITAFLRECEACAVIAITLGAGVDTLINRAQAESMANAFMIDEMANNAVSSLLSETLLELNTASGLHKTRIITPGCPHLPLYYQQTILNVLNAYKTCGITAFENGTLLPAKSMTGIAGLSRAEIKKPPPMCEACGQCY